MNEKIWVTLGLLLFGIILVFVYKQRIKEALIERTKKNAVKIPNIQWRDGDGVHIEDIVLKRSGLPLLGDWNRIYPAVDENENPNWINIVFGGYKNFIWMLIVLMVIGFFLLGYWEVFNSFEVYKQTCIQINNTIIP